MQIQFDLTFWPEDPSTGDKYLLTVVDHFSKKVWCKSLPTKESEPISRFLNEIFQSVGLPDAVLADNGKEFRGAVDRLLSDNQVQYLHGKPYASTTQGAIERANQTIAHAVEALMKADGQYRYWARFVPRIVAGYNDRVHSTTGATPNDVFHAQCGGLPLTEDETLRLHERVRLNTIKRANADGRRQLAELESFTPFEINDLVFVYSPSKVRKRGPASPYAIPVPLFELPLIGACLHRWHTFGRVQEKLSNNQYIVMYLADSAHVKTGQISSALHHRYLAPVPDSFSEDALRRKYKTILEAGADSSLAEEAAESLAAAANASRKRGDPNEFFGVELVLAQRRVDGEHQYYIKWAGYDWTECSWEPASSLSDDLLESAAVKSARDVTRLKNAESVLEKFVSDLRSKYSTLADSHWN